MEIPTCSSNSRSLAACCSNSVVSCASSSRQRSVMALEPAFGPRNLLRAQVSHDNP